MRRTWSGAVWVSGFRPLYLAGSAYAVLAMGIWIAAHFDAFDGLLRPFASAAWHGHEMVFGFAGAIAGGFILTALPSWAHTPHVAGRPLAALLGLWALGRAAMLGAPLLPPVLVAALDVVYLPALVLTVAPGALAATDRRYTLVLPILLGLTAGNIVFHVGATGAAPAMQATGLGIGVYGLMVLFSFVGGLLTPIFTETALRAEGWRGSIGFSPVLETLAPVALVALAVSDLAGLPPSATAATALTAAAVLALRMRGWRSFEVLDKPLLLAMHLGYAWLIVALALKAGAALTGWSGSAAALHAFTIGALGLTKISLMTRVVLKHTGRPVAIAGPMVAGYASMFAAVMLRLAAAHTPWREPLLLAAAVLWMVPFALYLAAYGRMLVSPSLPRAFPATGPAGP